MKEAIIRKGPKVEIIDSAVPEPGPDQVVTKVVVSGSNPKDWKLPEWFDSEINQGDDIAGTIHSVGSNVTEFKPGDRVGAFHEMRTPGGSYAEYALSWAHTTFHIPKSTSFEEAAAIPLAALTAVVGLYSPKTLDLPDPWTPAKERIPLIVYGGSSAVGSYVIQLARQSNIHPIIAIAGRAQDHVKALIDESKGDVVIDYRKGPDAVASAIKDAAKGKDIFYAYDAISEHGSYETISKVLSTKGGKFTTVLPLKNFEVPKGIEHSLTSVGSVHSENKDLGFIYSRFLARGLQEGWFKPQPQEVVPGGLGGVEKALTNLKEGKASAVKYVFRIVETDGLSS